MKKIIQISTVMDHIGGSRTLVVALTEDGKVFFKDLQDDGHTWECVEVDCSFCDKTLNDETIRLNYNNDYLCLDCHKKYVSNLIREDERE